MKAIKDIFHDEFLQAEERKGLVREYGIPDLIDQWDSLDSEERFTVFHFLEKEDKSDLLIELSFSQQEELFRSLSKDQTKSILEDLEPDDLVDLIQEVSPEIRMMLWEQLSPSAKKETLYLRRFDEDDAAGLMTPRYLAIQQNVSVQQALAFVRKNARTVEAIYYIYVIDHNKRLHGVCSLKDLLCSSDTEIIKDIMNHDVISVREDTDQEDAAKILESYDLVSLPVVDGNGSLMGIITFDDVLDVIREEQTEDVYKMGAMEGSSERYLDTSVWGLVKKRIPWLILLLLLGTVSTNVVSFYNGIFQNAMIMVTFLLIFMPVITQTGGNSGSQSATLMIRGLATGQIHFRDFWHVVLKELRIGLLIGLITGIVIFGRSILFPPHVAMIEAVTIGVSLGFVVLFSTLVGAIAPLIIFRLGFDPTVMSAPLMATLIDVCGLTLYFEIAKFLLSHFS